MSSVGPWDLKWPIHLLLGYVKYQNLSRLSFWNAIEHKNMYTMNWNSIEMIQETEIVPRLDWNVPLFGSLFIDYQFWLLNLWHELGLWKTLKKGKPKSMSRRNMWTTYRLHLRTYTLVIDWFTLKYIPRNVPLLALSLRSFDVHFLSALWCGCRVLCSQI